MAGPRLVSARHVGGLVLGSLLVLILTGCSIGSPVPVSPEVSCAAVDDCEWTDFDGMVADWERTADTLELPPGASLREPERGDFGEGEQEFSGHYGESIAHSEWFCLWEGELLDQSDPDGTEAATAIAQLRLFLETRTFTEDYTGDVGIVAMVDEAADGDLDRLRNDCDVNCTE